MWLFKNVMVCVVLLSLNHCTFRPLYGTHDEESSEHLAYIKINNIEGRLGQVMRNVLLQKLTPQGQPSNPLYALSVSISFSDRDLGIAKDATATRSEVTLSVTYTLTDHKTGKVLYEGKEVESTDYNILTNSYYSNIVSKNNAQEGVIEFMANLIKLSLASYLNSPQKR
jgi:LPS-assembly lipoprotein